MSAMLKKHAGGYALMYTLVIIVVITLLVTTLAAVITADHKFVVNDRKSLETKRELNLLTDKAVAALTTLVNGRDIDYIAEENNLAAKAYIDNAISLVLSSGQIFNTDFFYESSSLKQITLLISLNGKTLVSVVSVTVIVIGETVSMGIISRKLK